MIKARRLSLGLVISGLFSLSLTVASAVAAPVTFQFSGHLTLVDPIISTTTGFTAGHTFAVTYIFESTTPETPFTSLDPRRGIYEGAVSNIWSTINAQLVIAPSPNIASSAIEIGDNSSGNFPVDFYGMSAKVNTTGTDWQLGVVSFGLSGGSSAVFADDTLPTHPPSLASFANKEALFIFSDGFNFRNAFGIVDSLTAVPIPTTALLFGMGLLVLIGLTSQIPWFNPKTGRA